MRKTIIFNALTFAKTFIGYAQDTLSKHRIHKVIETEKFTINSNFSFSAPYSNFDINSSVYYPNYCVYDSCFENNYIENISYSELRFALPLFSELTNINKSRIQIFKWLSLNLQQEASYKDYMGFYSGETP